MIKVALVLFILLWLLGFIHIRFFGLPLLVFGSIALTLQNLLYIIMILFLINFLPGIFRMIAIVLFILWLLSNFGFLLIGGLTNVILLFFILVVIFSLV